MAGNVGWFAVCLIGGWCALAGAPRDAVIYWAGVIILFAVGWIWFDPDPGSGAWMAGTTLSALAAC